MEAEENVDLLGPLAQVQHGEWFGHFECQLGSSDPWKALGTHPLSTLDLCLLNYFLYDPIRLS